MKVIEEMPEEEYRAVKALCQSDVKKIIASVPDYLYGLENPEEETKGKTLGKAYHNIILEDKEDLYQYPLDKNDYLCTKEDYIEAANSLNADFKPSWNKDKIKEAILNSIDNATYRAEFFDDAIQELNESGRIILDKYDLDKINSYKKQIYNSPLGNELKDAPKEISLFWEEDGVPMKARFDALVSDGVFDLKTFDNSRGKNTDKAVINAIIAYDYILQACFYCNAYSKAYEAKIKGFEAKHPVFYMLWLQTNAGINIRHKVLSDTTDNNINGYWGKSQDKINQAKDLYRKYVVEGQKIQNDFLPEPLTDQELPLYYFD